MSAKTKDTAKKSKIMVYNMKNGLCVWSKAGVKEPFLCVNAFDCLNCPVDLKMKADIRRGRLRDGRAPAGRPWFGEDRPAASEARKCRHMLSGRVSVKYCINDYDCARCEYHQWMLDSGLSDPPGRPEQDHVGGFALAGNYYYHQGHVWARIEYGGLVRVGLDDFAVRLFGPFSGFELPGLGQVVRQGEPGFEFRRNGLSAKCLSPLEGVVVAKNPKARKAGGVEIEDPYDDGWLLVLEPQKLRLGLRNLFQDEESRAWMEDEAERLTAMASGETDYPLAAAGGTALSDIYGRTPGLDWDRLKKEFLRT